MLGVGGSPVGGCSGEAGGGGELTLGGQSRGQCCRAIYPRMGDGGGQPATGMGWGRDPGQSRLTLRLKFPEDHLAPGCSLNCGRTKKEPWKNTGGRGHQKVAWDRVGSR